MNEVINNKKSMTYINITKHAIQRCIERHPTIRHIKIRKYAEKEAQLFLETLTREWLSNRWNIKKTTKEWYVVIQDFEHKIVYKKELWEVIIITYWYKDKISLLEWKVLWILKKIKS